MSSLPVLSGYDVDKPVTLTCDASQYGLGAACLQEGKPVAYALSKKSCWQWSLHVPNSMTTSMASQ